MRNSVASRLTPNGGSKNMKRLALGLGLAAGALALAGDALACGDKLVVVGRGLRPQRMKASPQRGAILLYVAPGSSVSKIVEDGRFRKDIERAGHRVRSVTTKEELGSALQTGSYDLVLADIHTLNQVEGAAKAGASKPTVLPTLYNPTDEELAAAKKQFYCVLDKSSSARQQQDYLAVVNDALSMRAKEHDPKAKPGDPKSK